MYIQKTRGPKYLIPRSFRQNQFVYLRKFRNIEDLEANRVDDSDDNFNRAEPSAFDDCAICMHNLRFEVDDQMQLMDGTSTRARTYL